MERFDTAFDNFLDQSDEKVLLVKGQWGIGKTHSIERGLDRNSSEYTSVTVSLFGLSDLNDLSRSVSESILNKYVPKKGTDFFKMVTSVPLISKFIPQKLPLLDKINIKYSLENFIVFFDDIERTSIDIKDFFGYVDQIKNASPFKVIIALNDNQISDPDIWKVKEKVVDKELRVVNTLDSMVEEIFQTQTELPLAIFRRLKVVNLRVIIKSKQVMNLFCEKAQLLNEDNVSRLKSSCLCLSAKYYSSEDFDSSRLENVSSFDKHFSLNSTIESYLDSQTFDEEVIESKISYLVSQQVEKDNNEKFKEIVELFEGSFDDNSEQIIDLSQKFITENISNERQLAFIINMLNKLGVTLTCEDVEKLFEGEYKRSQWFVRDILDIFSSGDVYEFIKSSYVEKKEESEPEETTAIDETNSLITSILYQASHSNLSFFEADLSIYSPEDWVAFIEMTSPVSLLSQIQDGILEFIEKEEGANLRTALSILMEKPIQNMRLGRIFGKNTEMFTKYANKQFKSDS